MKSYTEKQGTQNIKFSHMIKEFKWSIEINHKVNIS